MSLTDIAAGVGTTFGGPLVGILVKAGAPVLADVLAGKTPAADKVLEAIGGALGVEPTEEAIVAKHQTSPQEVEDTVRGIESDSPDYWAYLANADKLRMQLFAQEAAEPWFAWAWRPAWMWMLGALWIWTAVSIAMRVPTIDLATLLGLTGIFAGLYMGGHAAQDIFGKVWGGKAG
jgi:hypothetical protein